MTIDFSYRPDGEADLARCLADPMWRICSGALYKIMVKSDEGDGTILPFYPNDAQHRLIARLWHRNIILKARQRGITTLVAILWLDHSLFNPDQRCGIIAQDQGASEYIFRDKVKLAYEHLPDALKQMMPLARDSATELLFAHNNSSVRVATSMRSGTINRLHISEFGKICAKFPDKAAEVVRGSLPAVPLDGITIIESTAEGRDGYFFTMTERAKAASEMRAELSERDYRFHFFPWFEDAAYRIDSASVVITDKDKEYFNGIEAMLGVEISDAQRRWYVATREADFSGDGEAMWQEYPSTADEAFCVSTEGTYYAAQLAQARKEARIGAFPVVSGLPVNTFWDIGSGDGTGIWLHQKVGKTHRFIGYIEGWAEPYDYYIKKLQALGYTWGTHFLPHDAGHQRQQGKRIVSPIEMLRELGIGGKWDIVPVVDEVITGIQLTRSAFKLATFDETACADGLAHLQAYRKTWNERAGCWSDKPRHDIHSEAADAFRQWAQAIDNIGIDRRAVLEVGKIRLWPAEEPLPTLLTVVQSYRPALEADKMDDFTACVVLGTFQHKGRVRVLIVDAWQERLGYDKLRPKVKQDLEGCAYGADDLAKRADYALIERKGSGISLIQDLSGRAGNRIRGYQPGNLDKVARARLIAPLIDDGELFVVESKKNRGDWVSWAQWLKKELRQFPMGNHDDGVDALVQGMRHLHECNILRISDDIEPDDDYAPETKPRVNPYAN